jgi:hypothetical protein
MDAKYTYFLWRPVTAIRAVDTDGNAETTADPNWLPEVTKTNERAAVTCKTGPGNSHH